MAFYVYKSIVEEELKAVNKTAPSSVTHRWIHDFIKTSDVSTTARTTLGRKAHGTHSGPECARFRAYAKDLAENYVKRSYSTKNKNVVAVDVKPTEVTSSATLVGQLKSTIQQLRNLGYDVKCKVSAPAQEL